MKLFGFLQTDMSFDNFSINCLRKWLCLRVGSHDPFFGSNYLSGSVSGHRNVDLRH